MSSTLPSPLSLSNAPRQGRAGRSASAAKGNDTKALEGLQAQLANITNTKAQLETDLRETRLQLHNASMALSYLDEDICQKTEEYTVSWDTEYS